MTLHRPLARRPRMASWVAVAAWILRNRILLGVLLSGLVVAMRAPAATVFDRATNWRWRPGASEASTPLAAWRERDFNDAGFTTAPAPFWYDTGGDTSTLSQGTRISGMQGSYSCFFLRKTFVVTEPSEVSALRLEALVDDGFVAWINGTEVLRVRVPGAAGSPVTIATLGDNAPEPVPFVTYELPPPPGYLVPGTNVLAVQVFQSSLGSSDVGFDAALDAVLPDARPPRVVEVTPNPGTVTNLTAITVRFDEPVAGVTAAHLMVNGVGATVVSALNSSTYRFTFVQPPFGDVAIGWHPNQRITDLAIPPNPFDATGPGATWQYTLVDRTPPSLAALTPVAFQTVRSVASLTVRFTEPVTGVDRNDLRIQGVPATAVTAVGASEYVFTFAEPAPGEVQVSWDPGHGIRDLASPPNPFAAEGWTYRLDPSAREVEPYISEFMASNTHTLADETGAYSDWIEIYNPSSAPVNLEGWHLTDAANNPTKWRFPATNLAGGRFLVVFASGNDRRIPGAPLHTSFQLSAGGEYLALVRPDGEAVTRGFGASYPQQVADVSFGLAQTGPGPEYATSAAGVYFTQPTPRAANLGGTSQPGPILESVQHSPNVPLDDEDLRVTARVLPTFQFVDRVTLHYRVMFAEEVTSPMFDDGAHGDGAAGDGVFGATIPQNLSTNGQMIRYYVAATDRSGNTSRWPLFPSPTDSEEYLGTVVQPTGTATPLPVFHLFVGPTQLSPIDSESGGRLSFFYDGEFYDNIYMELRGNTSAGLLKKSHRLEFLRGHELRHAGPGGRSRRSALLAEYLDPAYLRQYLCFWFLNQIGVPAPYDYPVQVRLNGQFYQLAFHNEVIGPEQVERLGYDPAGALYKAVGTLTPDFFSTGVFQKLEPDDVASRADYLQLANGIQETVPLATRRRTAFDLLDLPQVINHLAGTRWCSENDDVWANMSLYRDTFGDGLWRCIPFDMNASWGQLYGGSSPLQASTDSCKSHPLYGSSRIPPCDGPGAPYNFNRLYDVIVAIPETRQMLLRRQRSILDQMVKPPGTPSELLILENHIRFMTNRIGADANLDRAKWGSSPWAPGKTFHDGVSDLLNQFVGPRRRHWYVTHSITNTARPIGITATSNAGIPLSQEPATYVSIAALEFTPAGGNPAQEYLCISNHAPVAVDLTGWTLEGGIDFRFAPGTVLPSNSVAYVSPNPRAFRERAVSPRGGEGRFVLGPYQGQLSARGETVRVKNPLGQVMSTHRFAGAPSLAQQYLRVTEIMYHPAALPGSPTDPEAFEYIELRNIASGLTLDLTGIRLTNGVDFNFTGSAVTSLTPGGRVLVVKNAAAFAVRYGSGLPVAGQYSGSLDNDGGHLRLLDAANEEILDFDYADHWHPLTDGMGFSLAVVDEGAEPDAWNGPGQWRASGVWGGTPGQGEPGPATLPTVWITEVLTRSDDSSLLDAIELHNPGPTPADVSGWWLTDDFRTPAKYRLPEGTILPPGGFVAFDERAFNAGTTPFALGSDGDEVWLFSANRAGELTGYVHGHRFGASEDGVTFGRHVTSDGRERFVAQATRTLGQPNTGPRARPVVINEIHYHPRAGSAAGDDRDAEYLELLNASNAAVPMFDSTNTWRLKGGVAFDFPTNTTLLPGELVLVVAFQPAEAGLASAFRARYGVRPDVRLFGPYTGRLANAGDRVQLTLPTVLIDGARADIVLEEVEYKDAAPWPGGADGFGLSLQRRTPAAFANDPASWVAAPPTAGRPTLPGALPEITAQPASLELAVGAPASFRVTATGTEPLQYQWRFNGTLLQDATNAVLQSDGAAALLPGTYDVLAHNAAGSVLSSPATLSSFYPLTLAVQPRSPVVRLGDTVTLSVIAYSGTELTYQWRRDGREVPGATNAAFVISQVQRPATEVYDVVVTDALGSLTSEPTRLQLDPDADGDGLLDAWEEAYFGPGGTKPELDVDGDGMSNLAEFLAGTDPTLPGSVLRIQPDRVGDAVRFTFGARSNRTYTIQYKDLLTAPVWSKLRDVPAAATNRLELIEDPGGPAIRYYRVTTPQVP